MEQPFEYCTFKERSLYVTWSDKKGLNSLSDCVTLSAQNFKTLKCIFLKFSQVTQLCCNSLLCKVHWHRVSRNKLLKSEKWKGYKSVFVRPGHISFFDIRDWSKQYAKDSVVEGQHGIYSVPSKTEWGVKHWVDMNIGQCSCEQGKMDHTAVIKQPLSCILDRPWSIIFQPWTLKVNRH